MGDVHVSEIGEFGLIARLRHALNVLPQPRGLIVGNGDDAAVWKATANTVNVISTDTMIEGIHFTKASTPWLDLGWKSLAVNISDIAAMGATPTLAIITLGLTGHETIEEVDALYAGIVQAAQRYAVCVIGGDTVRSPQVQVGFAVVGELPNDYRAQGLRRAAAQSGDLLVVTGLLGDAAAGLELLLSDANPAADNPLVVAHRRPQPRVEEGRWLLDNAVACATDNSDGLLREATLLAEASELSAQIDARLLPTSSALRSYAGARTAELALRGGEEYELVCAVSPVTWERIAQPWQRAFAVPLTVVGQFVRPTADIPLVQILHHSALNGGFDHFHAQ